MPLSTDPLRVALILEHALLRDGLAHMLHPDATVVGGGDFHEVLCQLPTSTCQVVMLDMESSRGQGLSCLRTLKDRFPDLPVLCLASPTDEAQIIEALHAGADGYIVKSASREEVLRALQDLEYGLPHLYPGVAGAVLRALRNRHRAPTQPRLTQRERDILQLMARGLGVQQIAGALFLTQNTIKTHTRSLYRKLGVSDRTSAVLTGMRHGLIGQAASA